MGINSVVTPLDHHINSIPSIMMFRACLMVAAMVLCPTEASYGYGGSGHAYIIPGTEPRAIPGIYKQEYMQPVYITSYVPIHHEQHASPVQYVTVALNSGHHHAPAPVHTPALGGHNYAAAPAVSHGHVAAPVVSHDNTAAHVSYGHTVAAPVVSHDNTAAHVSHGHNVAPAISHGYSPVYQLVRSAPIRFTPSNEHGSLPSHGHITYY